MEIADAARKRKSPSEDAKHGALRPIQRISRIDAVRNERPMYLAGPPIQIYHPVFSKFLSLAFSPFDGDEETLQRTSEFIEASREFYDDEKTRVKAIGQSLSALVHSEVLNDPTNYTDGSSFKPDGTIYASHSPNSPRSVCAYVEVKNEIGTGGCDPALQCQSDFVKLCSSSTVGVLPIRDGSLLNVASVPADCAGLLLSYVSIGDSRPKSVGRWCRLRRYIHRSRINGLRSPWLPPHRPRQRTPPSGAGPCGTPTMH